jgi:hypothetical protein
MRWIGLPWSETLVRRTLIGTGSAVLAARLALHFGVACMCNGGTHHAHRDHGSGEGSMLGFMTRVDLAPHAQTRLASGNITQHERFDGGLGWLSWRVRACVVS